MAVMSSMQHQHGLDKSSLWLDVLDRFRTQRGYFSHCRRYHLLCGVTCRRVSGQNSFTKAEASSGAAVSPGLSSYHIPRTLSDLTEGPLKSRDDGVQRKLKYFHEGSEGPPLRILPLGGLGEIGMNCMLIGHYDRYILVDAGLMFPDYEEPGVQKVLPDTRFIHQWRNKIEAVIITHGHEDHIGALPWVVPVLDPCTKIFSTSFTVELIRRRLKSFDIPIDEGRLNVIQMRQRFKAGPFEIEAIRVTHSIPDCCGLVVRCKDGTILHTGDWKIDESPLDGETFDREALEEVAKEGVTLMMSDSTNILSPGRTTSEADVAETLTRNIESAKGRVIITQFASNIHRLSSVQHASELAGRKLVFIGLSLNTYLDSAWKSGKAPFDPSILIKATEMDEYAPKDLVIVTTGSQGEPYAALNIASFKNHPSLKLAKDDIILYSAKVIPTNAVRVMKMMNRIAEIGSIIVMGKGENLHASGHAYRGELEEVLRLVKPQHFLPVHGEFAFLKEHELLAKSIGVRHTAVIKNGEMLGVAHLRNPKVISSGFTFLQKRNLQLMYNDGDKALGTAAELCIHERRRISSEGLVIISVELKRPQMSTNDGALKLNLQPQSRLTGKIIITTRCLWVDKGKLIDTLRTALYAALASCPVDASVSLIQQTFSTVVSKLVRKYNNKRPEVIVLVTGDVMTVHDRKVNRQMPLRNGKHESHPSSVLADQAASRSKKIVSPFNFAQRQKNLNVNEVPHRKVFKEQSSSLTKSNDSSTKRRFPNSTHKAVSWRRRLLNIVTSNNVEVQKLHSLGEKAAGKTHENARMSKTGLQESSTKTSAGKTHENNTTSKTGLQEPSTKALLVPRGTTVDDTSSKQSTVLKASPKAPKLVKKYSRWKKNEIQKLVELRCIMDNEFRTSKKKPLWEKISLRLSSYGISKTPEQCKSCWSSLVKKYKGILEGKNHKDQWVLFDEMDKIMSS
eukprot:TRINITY_DN2467_c0_g2_i1.p1 TRINITY_DN2467_c0_g2~~TRINITY_DN2467_c0_g2_i1.p1  ORF type:complete len:972 (+),score=187.63 TRINITY_DN2467_c0_g2_i1:36-2918(+)